MARDADILKRSALVSDLSDGDLSCLLKAGTFARWKAGETIMREGEESDTMYLFLEGTVDVTKNLTLKTAGKGFGQAEKSMTRLKASSAPIFGEMSLFGAAPRSATVNAVSDCLLFGLGHDAYDALCAEHPRLGLSLTRKVAAILSSRVRKGNEDVLKLSTALSIALSR